MAEEQVKVSLWCVPRSLSTVLTKCLGAIDGMEVYFELFSYVELTSKMFESAMMGRKLPFKLVGNEKDYERMIEIWNANPMMVSADRKLIPRRISCHDIKQDLQNATSKYIFHKEMGYIVDHVQDYLPEGFRYVFLIREPSRVFASFRKSILAAKASQDQNKNYMHEDKFDIVRDDGIGVRPKSWYEKEYQLWKYVQEHIDPNPIIIDAFDLVSEPQKILKVFCEDVGFPYSDGLLQWAPSNEFPKNFVTPVENMLSGIGAQFYATAFKSTRFTAPRLESGPLPRDQLTDDIIECVDHSMPFYREMYENRLRAL
ncbi:uncharacterized protein LOC129276610 [Lytechinus pictus]|uniref:uncharacterized protein LOC129276610 n=1 Tax=Lytechinus pictus TaxID=7653 RepID=UPI0030BA1F61